MEVKRRSWSNTEKPQVVKLKFSAGSSHTQSIRLCSPGQPTWKPSIGDPGKAHTIPMNRHPLCHPTPVPDPLSLLQADGHFEVSEIHRCGEQEQSKVTVEEGRLVILVNNDLLHVLSLRMDIAVYSSSHDHSEICWCRFQPFWTSSSS